MLQTRRLLAVSGRVHTYTLIVYVFFFLLQVSAEYFFVSQPYLTVITFSLNLFAWINLLFGSWIIVFSCIVWGSDGMFPASPVVLTLLRMGTVFLLNTACAVAENLISGKLVIS